MNLSGFSDLNRRLKQLPRDVATKAGQVANRAGAVVLAKAIRNEAPDGPSPEGEVRTRHNKGGSTRKEVHRKIKNHVKVKKSKNAESTKVQNTVGVFAYHSTFVQFGSIHNAPNPFMQRALDASKQAIIDAMAKSLNRQLIKRGV